MSLFQAAFRIIDLPPDSWYEVPSSQVRRSSALRFPRLRLLATVLRVAVVTALEDGVAGLRQGGGRLVFAMAGAALPRMAFA